MIVARLQAPPEEAVTLMRAAGLEPLEPCPGTDTPWRCRCTTCGTIANPARATQLLRAPLVLTNLEVTR
ncbi:hypothetical protein ACWCRD_17085 [Streptomyces sp. NPDC002092]